MRRRFKPKTGFPLTKTAGDIARNRRFQKPSEISKAKRVRFDDAETDASSGGHEAAQSPKCGGPKTSEYAYFRKVKEGAVNGHFHALHKENEQLKSYKICDLPRVTNKESEELDPGIKDRNLSISGESAGPSGHKPFVSSPVSRYGESNEIRSKELTHKTKQRSSLLTETATPVKKFLISSRLNQATENFDLPCPEDECNEKGIFYEKRKKLRQWVAHTTSSEVGKLHGKRSDLVSSLMSRLIPKGNGNSYSSKENADITSESLTIYEPDNMVKGLPLSHKSDCHKELPKVSSERSSEIVLREWDRFDNGFTSNCREEGDLQLTMDRCRRSSEVVLREWDSFDSGFPFNYDKEGDHQKTMDRCGRSRSSEIVPMELDSFHPEFPFNYYKEYLQNKTMDPDQHSSSRICNSYDTRLGYSFCLPFESFRSLGAFHFKYPDESGPIVGHGREEHYRNSLEWDFGLEKGRFDHGTRQDVCHRLANDWKQQGIVDNVLDTEGFCPSPLFSSCCLIKPLPNYVSTGCLMREVQPLFDDVKYGMVKPGQFSLSFPNSPKRITLAEDKNADNDLPYSNILSSYRDPRLPNKVLDCRPHSDNWWKCSSAPEFSTEDFPQGNPAWQFPQTKNDSFSLSLLREAPAESYTSLSEGAFNHYPSTLHSPLDTFMNCPLLLNHASQDIHDQELCSDDYSNEMEYSRYM
ncbi:uncharacterized protein LOC121793590 isoform X1 [Salvia splendens]|uniref:uncharacterized protein LOC121793590 isoform X1 n=1 Tax=Salvia splendens TaxID=180675 RepID=UPI001C26CCE0|nr:uncharacterized protein LOC121793590 isoform X1 [Salvia splendens]